MNKKKVLLTLLAINPVDILSNTEYSKCSKRLLWEVAVNTLKLTVSFLRKQRLHRCVQYPT